MNKITREIQKIGIKNLKIDYAVQSRVTTSPGYMREFSEAMLRGDVFPPVTVFYDGEIYWLADGFHRVGAADSAGISHISAEVFPGTRRDALIFSAGANREFCIPRIDDDKRKACNMLFEDDEWFHKSDGAIADHVGISSSTAGRFRMRFCEETKRAPPERVAAQDGSTRIYKRLAGEPRIVNTKTGSEYRCSINGKEVYLGRNKQKAMTKFAQLRIDSQKSRRSLDYTSLYRLLSNHMKVEPVNDGTLIPGITGFQLPSGNVLCIPCSFSSGSALPEAIGRLMLSRVYLKKRLDLIVICYAEDGPALLIEIARKLGIDFLTPEEVVKRFSIAKSNAREARR